MDRLMECANSSVTAKVVSESFEKLVGFSGTPISLN